jgi:hypothetical protein
MKLFIDFLNLQRYAITDMSYIQQNSSARSAPQYMVQQFYESVATDYITLATHTELAYWLLINTLTDCKTS